MSSVCQLARDRKALSIPTGLSAAAPVDVASSTSTFSTLRATVTGQWIPLLVTTKLKIISSTTCRPDTQDEAQSGCNDSPRG
jgi:hypothetical protein